jgi:hypothetical protein
MLKKREARVDSPDLSTTNAFRARCGLSTG